MTVRLRAALTAALRAADSTATAALRSALAAIANAEAVPVTDGRTALASSQHIAGAAVGPAAAEAARRVLSEAQIEQIVAGEIADRQSAAVQYDELGRPDRAQRLRQEAAVLSSLLDGELAKISSA